MRGLFAILCLLYAVPVFAQTGIPTQYVFVIYQGQAPVSTATVQKTQLTCGLPKSTGGSTNPTKWRFDDPANPATDCVYDDTTRLMGLPDGNYEGTARAVNADGSSPETARVPFVRRRPNPPGVPTGLRISD